MERRLKKFPEEENSIFTEEIIGFFADMLGKEFVLSFQHRLFKKDN